MLAVIGRSDDPVCVAVRGEAEACGLTVACADGTGSWSLAVTLPGTPAAGVSVRDPAGRAVGCVLNRGLPPRRGRSSAENNDLLAAWWAALALFPGRVLNRPDASGFLPSPSARTALLTTAPPPAGGPANVHDVATGRFLHRLAPGTPGPSSGDDVVAVTAFVADRTWRVVLVGERVIDVALPATGLDAAERTSGLAAVRALAGQATPGLTLVVLERADPGRMRVVALDPMPGPQHYAPVAAQVHRAVLDWLRS